MRIEGNKIIVNKVKNELDLFVVEFLKILKKYAEYVVSSGYVSILLGRTRATDDVAIFIKPISFHVFSKFYKEAKDSGYWCINVDDEKEIFDYLLNKVGVRFAKLGKTVPNFEIKFPKDDLDDEIEH